MFALEICCEARERLSICMNMHEFQMCEARFMVNSHIKEE